MLLVFGSINADLVFRPPRLPRPGETVLCPSYAFAPGGKGANQAAAAAKAGAEVRFVGRIGQDGHGVELRAILAAAGVDCGGLGVSDQPTGVAIIAVDPAGENSIVVASGANLDAAADQIDDAAAGPGVTLLCQNELRPQETAAALLRAKSRGARTILNMAPARELAGDALAALDVLVVNEIEAAAVAGREGDPVGLARDLAGRFGLTCVVTLGARGALAFGSEGALRIAALPVEPVDTTGAGDAFVGVLAAGLDQGQPLPLALRRASVAAALACTRVGAQTSQPSGALIDARLGELPEPQPLA